MNDDDGLVDLWAADRFDERNRAAGPQPQDIGVVTQVSPLLVNCNGLPEPAVAVVGRTFAVGDSLLINRVRGLCIAVDKIGTGAAPSPPAVEATTGQSMFPAGFAYSWRDGTPFSYEPGARQGQGSVSGAWTGAWFYQGGPRAALSGATVTGCAVQLIRAPGGDPGAQPAHVTLSPDGVWPTADITSPPAATGAATDCALMPGDAQWFTLPTAVGQALVDGDVGLMVSGTTPVLNLADIDTEPECGLLRIDWTR